MNRYISQFFFSLTILTLGIVFTIPAISAQTPVKTPVSQDDDVIKVESRLIVVPVSVTDGKGDPISGLQANDFTLTEEGQPQTIDHVGTADTVPLEIALLFDVSASTDKMFRYEQETAAKFLQNVMRPIDRATIFTVGEEGKLIQPRDTAERSMVSIRSIVPTKQQTAFYDSLRTASLYLKQNAPQGVRKVIVIISDGEDTTSSGVVKAIWNAERKIADDVRGPKLRELRVKARDAAKIAEQDKVLKSLQDADAVFYSINPAGSSFQLNQMSVFGQSNMQRFADETGGTAFLPKFSVIDTKDPYQNEVNVKKNQDILDQIFRQLANELRSQYLIQYYSESEFPLNKFVKLNVGLTKRSELRVRSRQGYFVTN